MSAAVVENESPWIAPRRFAFQPRDRSPPRNGRKLRPCPAAGRSARPAAGADPQGLQEPGVQVAAIGERAALAEAPAVEAVQEEPRTRNGRVGLVHDAQRGRGPDHQRGSSARGAPRADVRARAVAERGADAGDRLVGDRRQLRSVDPDRRKRLVVPVEPVRIEEAGAARRRDARPHLTREPKQQVVAEREIASRPQALFPEAADLRRPVGGVREAAGAEVVGVRVQRRRTTRRDRAR